MPGPETHRRIKDYEDLLLKLARLKHIKAFAETLSPDEAVGCAQVVVGEATIVIPLEGAIDVKAEKERLQKELQKASSEINEITKKLSNLDFMARAPQEIIETQQSRLENAHLASHKLTQALQKLG